MNFMFRSTVRSIWKDFSLAGERSASVDCRLFEKVEFSGQATKGTRGMSWCQEATKGVEVCDKPGGIDKRVLIPGLSRTHWSGCAMETTEPAMVAKKASRGPDCRPCRTLAVASIASENSRKRAKLLPPRIGERSSIQDRMPSRLSLISSLMFPDRAADAR